MSEDPNTIVGLVILYFAWYCFYIAEQNRLKEEREEQEREEQEREEQEREEQENN